MPHGVPRYLRHSSGQARTIINGKTYYLGKHGSKASHRRYDALIAEWLASGRSETYGLDEGSLLVQDLLLGYLRHAKAYYGTGTTSEYHRIKEVFKVVRDLYADLEAVQLGPQQYKAVRQRLIAKDWSRNYINAQMKRLSRAWKWAAAEGMLPASVYETLRLIPSLKRGRTDARETKPVLPVSEAVVDETVKHCSPVVADMIRVQMLTGCRPGEVCKLTPAMIDRSGDVWTATLSEHKTAHHGKARVLYFGPEAQELLKPYLLRDPNECLFRPCDSEKKRRDGIPRQVPENCGNRVGYSKRTRAGRAARRKPGTQYTTQAYGQAIKYACEKGNLPYWAPNQLRHAAATRIRAEHGLEVAQILLGHSKLETSQVYAERDEKRALDVVKRIG